MATFWGKNKFIDKERGKKFKATRKIGRILWIDDNNELLAIAVKDGMKPNYIFEQKKFRGYSIFSNEKEIGKKSGLGRAVGGGLLFGPAGAIVGAVTGKKDAESVINSLKVRVEIEQNGKVDCETIPVIYMRKVKIDSTEYRYLEKEMIELVDCLDSLLNNNEK